MVTDLLICNTIIDLMETTPYYKIKVSKVIEKAGISRSTFYFHFESVPEAIERIELDFIKGLSNEQDAIRKITAARRTSKSYEELIQPTISYVHRNLKTFRILAGPNGDPAFQQMLVDRIHNIYTALFTTVSDDIRTDVELTCALMASAQWSIYSYWANNEDTVTEDEIVAYVAKLLNNLKSLF